MQDVKDVVGVFGWWSTLTPILVAIIVSVGGLLLVYLTNSTRMMKRIDDLTEKVFDLQNKEIECIKREADLKAAVASLTRRIAALEEHGGVHVGELRSGVVVAGLDGIIRVFSPSLVPLFKWLPIEVVGKPITILMPEDIKHQHTSAFTRYTLDQAIDPSKVILTYACDKFGKKFPVSITLDGFHIGKEGLVTATIKERVEAHHE